MAKLLQFKFKDNEELKKVLSAMVNGEELKINYLTVKKGVLYSLNSPFSLSLQKDKNNSTLYLSLKVRSIEDEIVLRQKGFFKKKEDKVEKKDLF